MLPNFDMLQAIKILALSGGAWVLYILLILSVLSVAVILNRLLFFSKISKGADLLDEKLSESLSKGKLPEVRKLLEGAECPEAMVLKAGFASFQLGKEALEQVLESRRIQEKMAMEKYLLVLGTLGNNAPFIGLFGTVLGIIKAFNDLAANGASDSKVVMGGVSEALVATAVGLLIAIPAVIFYNYFQGRIKRILSNSDRLSRLLLAHSRGKRR